MTIKGTKDSHIQIPRSLLEGFSSVVTIENSLGKKEKPKMVFRMNMDGNISRVNIKEANTEFGYYEDIIESNLLETIEKDFGELKAKILVAIKKNTIPSLTPKDIIITRKFCSLCLIRSQVFVQDIRERSYLIDFIANAPQNSVVYQYYQTPGIVDNYVMANNLSYVKNESNLNYVLPQFYVIGIKLDGVSNYFIPISPKVLIQLTSAETICGNKLLTGRMGELDVDNLNKYAIMQEFKHNNRAIYAKEEKDLEKYVTYIKTLK